MSSLPGCSASQVWEAALNQLLFRVTRQNYDTWLRNTTGLRFEGTTLVVGAPTELACDWLSGRMRPVILPALVAVGGAGLQVAFEPSPAQPCRPAPLQPSLIASQRAPLNPRFTFDTYIAGDFNCMAITAATQLALCADLSYSPLFVTAPSGMGKTHLLHAAAQLAGPESDLLLVSADQFLSEFTNSLRIKAGAAFRSRYRDVDFLLIDDVHQLAGKKATLNEFFQTIAHLQDQGRRIIVAGDIGLMESGASRFSSQLRWGLVAPIEQPPAEDRIRFVQMRAAKLGIDLPEEVKHYLGLRVRSSMRDLEGAVNRVSALARISREPVTIDFAARALQPVASLPRADHRQVPANALVRAVCDHLNLGPAELVSPRRTLKLTYGRHLAMYMLREESGLTCSAIAHLFNKKDHSTVVHALKQVQKELPLSPSLRADIDSIRVSIHTQITAA